MGEDYGQNLTPEERAIDVPLIHGPYLPLDIDRRDPEEYDSPISYLGSLHEALTMDGLELSDVAIQSLWQHARRRAMIEGTMFWHGYSNTSLINAYLDTLGAMEEEAGNEPYANLFEFLVGAVDRTLEDEAADIEFERELERKRSNLRQQIEVWFRW